MRIIFYIIAAICIVYGFLVLATHSGTSFFVVWFLIGLIFIVLAILSRFHIWGTFSRALRIVIIVAAGIAVAVFITVEILIAGAFYEKGEKDLDYIIVLGAQIRENRPSTVLKYRLDKAYDYLTENENTICIVSGGRGPNEPVSEAEGMRRYLVERGIDPDRILAEPASLNTKQNIEYSKKMIDTATDRVGIVTNNFHLFRACAIAKKAGVTNVCGIAAGSTGLYLPNNMFREFFGVMKDFLVGNMV